MFDSNFNYGCLLHPNLPKKFAPYGMREINGKLWVTLTPLNKGQDGAVDVFNPDGTIFKHDAAHGPPILALALAPPISAH